METVHRGRRNFLVKRSSDDDDVAERSTPEASTEGGGTAGIQYCKNRDSCGGGDDLWSLGQTLLAEANIVIGVANAAVTGKKENDGRGGTRTRLALRLSSLDGLARGDDGVRKTLRGFVVEAKPVTAEGKRAARSGGGRTGYAAFSVPTVQKYLESKMGPATAGGELGLPSAALASMLETHPLDGRGNYPDINALLGQPGQRALFQSLLGSCRVVVPSDIDSRIAVQPLRTEDGDGLSASFIRPSDVQRPGPEEGSQEGDGEEGGEDEGDSSDEGDGDGQDQDEAESD